MPPTLLFLLFQKVSRLFIAGPVAETFNETITKPIANRNEGAIFKTLLPHCPTSMAR